MARLLPSAAVLLSFGMAAGSSMYLAKMCRGQTCDDPAFPLLDYDEASESCLCRQHPCWSDDGKIHTCTTEDYPFLKFKYEESGKLVCECSSTPHAGSVYIASGLCAGHDCQEPEFPILDYDEEKGECICRANPCQDLDGIKHECSDPDFPILRYREEEPEEDMDEAKPVCECGAKIGNPPEAEL
mmetsp:Transcript_48587/g.141495  ORF Transcript_48587/g.141495 Transcript_48587/m.141495 type:complete len:185 (-) Transcript_48587:144-698(-)